MDPFGDAFRFYLKRRICVQVHRGRETAPWRAQRLRFRIPTLGNRGTLKFPGVQEKCVSDKVITLNDVSSGCPSDKSTLRTIQFKNEVLELSFLAVLKKFYL